MSKIIKGKEKTYWFFYEIEGHTVSFEEGMQGLLDEYGYTKEKLQEEFTKVKTQNPLEIMFGRTRETNTFEQFYKDCENYLIEFNGAKFPGKCTIMSKHPNDIENAEGFINFVIKYFACKK